MPDKPGPRPVGPQTGTTPDQTLPVDAEVAGDGTVAAPPDAAGASSPGHGEAAPAEPTPEDAVEVVRDYYSSIDAQNYAHAFALWADGGHASEQTPQQFADGFANTAHVALETGEPGTIEGAAGSRFIQVPVSIDATLRDGSSLEYTGIYTLRRAMVDGANADQRAWRIASASIREVKQ